MSSFQVLFIGELNQTNTIICDCIKAMFTCQITTHSAPQFFTENIKQATSFRETIDLIIYDLNTSSGFRNVQKNLKQIRTYFHEHPVVVIDPYQDDKLTDTLYRGGVQGILPVTPAKAEISRTIRSVLKLPD